MNVVPGCELIASWPRGYHDIYFGQDNCLYDSGNNRIDGQCCTSKTITSVANPYFKQAPSSSSYLFPQCTVDVSSLSCAKNCCGFLPCPAWCVTNCGGVRCWTANQGCYVKWSGSYSNTDWISSAHTRTTRFRTNIRVEWGYRTMIQRSSLALWTCLAADERYLAQKDFGLAWICYFFSFLSFLFCVWKRG